MACFPTRSTQRLPMSQVVVDLKECLQIEKAKERSRTRREQQENASSSTIEMVPVDIEPSIPSSLTTGC
ncbi:hypothetical protein RHMOL_Rhmol12G0238900 [Rhododendron molle]|uniref:Uncharacterized protein n=1 Tax=Rhododendron molle TaxID=49168 RepID=A0ACC0LMR2_RHOML|nr:hypothetical protein RHMOL_Rhmol12G0238900 [Rhododendron molle]